MLCEVGQVFEAYLSSNVYVYGSGAFLAAYTIAIILVWCSPARFQAARSLSTFALAADGKA